jgi:hypothetical protein
VDKIGYPADLPDSSGQHAILDRCVGMTRGLADRCTLNTGVLPLNFPDC